MKEEFKFIVANGKPLEGGCYNASKRNLMNVMAAVHCSAV